MKRNKNKNPKKRNDIERVVETEWQRKRLAQIKLEEERLTFKSKIENLGKPRIADGAWINALTNENYTWQLTVTFPCKLPKDKRMKEFKEEIQNAFEKIYLID